MVSTKKDPVLAVLSLSGGNDGLNTVIPRNSGLYRDFRPTLGIPEDQIIPINDELGFHPAMGPLKKFWDQGKLAIFLGIGYATPSYSQEDGRAHRVHPPDRRDASNDRRYGRVPVRLIHRHDFPVGLYAKLMEDR